MLKLPFYNDGCDDETPKPGKALSDDDDDDDHCTHARVNDSPSKRSQAGLIEIVMNKQEKEFGARFSSKDGDCMDQANFVALAMERKRRRDTQEIVHQAASLLTDLFKLSPITQQKERVSLASILESLDLGESDPASEEIHFAESDSQGESSSPCRTCEISNVDFSAEIMTRQSFENLQSFSDILKSEAMKRRQKKGR
jgi:hypothetical protein